MSKTYYIFQLNNLADIVFRTGTSHN